MAKGKENMTKLTQGYRIDHSTAIKKKKKSVFNPVPDCTFPGSHIIAQSNDTIRVDWEEHTVSAKYNVISLFW